MARPLRIAYPGALYHIVNRGHRRELIFRNDGDRREFIEKLSQTIHKYRIVLHGWCLMPNHFHLLIETPDANISAALHALQSSYANWFRIKYRLAGSVFQGRFKGVLVENETHLLRLLGYIHQNPVRAGICKRPEEHPWSSFRRYLGTATDEITATGRMLALAGGMPGIVALASRQENDPTQIYGKYSVLGGDDFFHRMRETLGTGEPALLADMPDAKRLCKFPPLTVERAVCAVMHIAPELLHKRWTHHPARKLFLYLLRTDTGLASGEIARRYGISAVAMSSLYSRFSRMVADDRSLQKTIATIRKRYGKL